MMIQRRAADASIETKISAHSFRATGITTYLQNGGKLEVAQQMAGHESARTTGLYGRRNDAVELDEVERVVYRPNDWPPNFRLRRRFGRSWRSVNLNHRDCPDWNWSLYGRSRRFSRYCPKCGRAD